MGLAGSLYRVGDSSSYRASPSRTSVSKGIFASGGHAPIQCFGFVKPTILLIRKGVHQCSYPSNPASAYSVDHFRRPNVEIKDAFSSLFLYNHLDDEFPHFSPDVEMWSHSA